MNRKPLVILTGPTGVGKTELSIKLAKEIGGEIISADSMQVYTHMDIGSAKIKTEEMQGIPHYLIDIISPLQGFDVQQFQTKAKEALETIYHNNRIPILVGGTGFYIQALLYDIDFTKEAANESLRAELQRLLEEKGSQYLHDQLREVDPASAEAIHPNNHKRVIRALEFYQQHNSPISKHNEVERNRISPYNFAYFVLTTEREKLYTNINLRVDQMLSEGLVHEVENLRNMGCKPEMTSMQGLGYKEILAYLNGSYDLSEAIYLIKRNTRHFAKRQLTWFQRERDVIQLSKMSYNSTDKLLDVTIKTLQERKILC